MGVSFTATVDGKTYGFDFEDQRIDIDATVDSMVVGNLWTAIKEAHEDSQGIVWPKIADGGGSDTLGTGIETYLTVTLLENWEVNTLKTSGKFEVGGGNLIREDQADPFRDDPAITYIAFLSQAGIATTVETGVSGLTPAESAQLSGTLREDRFKLLNFNKEVTRDGNDKIGSYGVNNGEFDVNVTYDEDGKVQDESIA